MKSQAQMTSGLPILTLDGVTDGEPSAPLTVGRQIALSTSFHGLRRDHESSDKENPPSPKFKSRSIPITNGMKRTPSELQLREDEELADFRDYVMFSRIVERISQQQTQDYRLRQQNDQCLAHVIGTRNGTQDQVWRDLLLQGSQLKPLATTQEEPPPHTISRENTPELGLDDEMFTLDM
jgi:hypothetical protein